MLSQRITHVGDVGSGQMLKLCNQLIVATNLVAIAEAICLARTLGLDASLLADAFAGGFADSAPLQTFGRRMALGATTPVLGAIATMHKDIQLAAETARAAGSPAPVASAAAEIYRLAAACGLASRDLAALVTVHTEAPRTAACSISPST